MYLDNSQDSLGCNFDFICVQCVNKMLTSVKKHLFQQIHSVTNEELLQEFSSLDIIIV